jgi:hypothetical protein
MKFEGARTQNFVRQSFFSAEVFLGLQEILRYSLLKKAAITSFDVFSKPYEIV